MRLPASAPDALLREAFQKGYAFFWNISNTKRLDELLLRVQLTVQVREAAVAFLDLREFSFDSPAPVAAADLGLDEHAPLLRSKLQQQEYVGIPEV